MKESTSNVMRSYILVTVARLKPGQQVRIGLREIEAAFPAQYPWTPPDRVLENIIGSGYEFGFTINPMNREVTFRRLEKPLTVESGLFTYVSADRKQYYHFDGVYYRRNNVPYVSDGAARLLSEHAPAHTSVWHKPELMNLGNE